MTKSNFYHEIESDNNAWINNYNWENYKDWVDILSQEYIIWFKRVWKEKWQCYVDEIWWMNTYTKYNYINEKWKLLSQKWFDFCDDFSKSWFAKVKIGNKYTLINYKWFLFKESYKEIWDFSEYWLAPVGKEIDKWKFILKEIKCNFINLKWELLTKQWFDMSYWFKDWSISGNCPVKLNWKWNYIDVDWEYISEEWFDVVWEFEDFRAYVWKIPEWLGYSDDNLVYNYLDINGNLILDKWEKNEYQVGLAMSEELYIGDIFIWIKDFDNWKYSFYDSENNLILEDIWDIEIIENWYYIKDKEEDSNKWKMLLKLYNEWKENIFNLDTNKLLFKDWYDYIKIPNHDYMKLITNFIVLDNNKGSFLTDDKWTIISQKYDNIDLPNPLFNRTYSITLGDEFNFMNNKWDEISEIWFDDCEDYSHNEFTKVSKWESKNYLSKNWKLLSESWFDECIFFNEWYAIVKINDKELIVWDYWNYEYECELEDNKYFQDKKIFDDFEDDKEFIAFFVYLDYYMSKTYEWPHWKMKDYTLWFDNVEETLKKFIFLLNNYKAFENKITFLNEDAFDNKYHHKPVWRREGLLSLAIHYLIESDEKLKNKYNGNFYYNIWLSYMDSFFKDLLQWYKDQWVWKSWEDKYEWWQESYILWEKMYDVIYWENIYLTYWEGQWTPFCTGWYLDCVKREYTSWRLIDWADPKTFIITDKWYSKDKNNIYRYGIKIEWIDIDSFEVLNYRYCKDKNKVVFYNPGNRSFDNVDWLDISSFDIIDKDYLKDKNNVYYFWKVVEWANPNKFEILSSEYSKDENNIYYNWEKCNWADYNTFDIIDENYVKDKNNISFFGSIVEWIDLNSYTIMDSYSYIKDKDNVFVYVEWEFIPNPWFKIIENVDIDSFELLEYNYSKDKNNMYFENKILEWIDPHSYEFLDTHYIYLKSWKLVYMYWEKIKWADADSFEFLDSWYSKDKNNIFHRENILEWADYDSFEILWERKAKDNNNTYFEWEFNNIKKIEKTI